MKKNTILKGMRDIFPDELKKFEYAISLIDEISKTYGYQKIKTPVLEKGDLFKNDRKSNYLFENFDNEQVCLRVNANLPIIRSIIDNKLYLTPVLPLKFSSSEDSFSYRRQLNNSKRQFEQYDFECFGVKSSYLDGEMILMATRILSFLGIEKTQVRIKSLMKDDKYLNEIRQMLSNLKVNYVAVDDIVNENNEFSDFIFEIDVKIGKKVVTVVRGGGHDEFVSSLVNQSFTSRGFSFYLDTVVDLMNSLKLLPNMNEEMDFYVSSSYESDRIYASFVALVLRDYGLKVETSYNDLSELESIKKAKVMNIPYLIIVKDDFYVNEEVKVVNIFSGGESVVKFDKMLSELEEIGNNDNDYEKEKK